MIYPSRISLLINEILNVLSSVTRAGLGNKFSAEPKEVDVEDKLQFYVRENDEDTTYMQLSKFWSYNRAYILDVDAKSSAAKLFSSLKAT